MPPIAHQAAQAAVKGRLSFSMCLLASVEPINCPEKEKVGVGLRAKSYYGEKAWSSIRHSMLFVWPPLEYRELTCTWRW
jgi:hypothetical protein